MSSYILVYTSDFEYRKDGQAVVKGGNESDDNDLPVPTPEPVTAIMLGLGGLAILRSRATIKK